MGMFDSYEIPWGASSHEIQSKTFESCMDRWRLGERVPVEEVGSVDGPWTLIEDFIVDDQFSNPRRAAWATLLHWDGVFCDFHVADSPDAAEAARVSLEALWSDPSWRARGFEILADLLRARNEASEFEVSDLRSLCREWLSESERPGARLPLIRRHDFSSSSFEAQLQERLAVYPPSTPLEPPFDEAASADDLDKTPGRGSGLFPSYAPRPARHFAGAGAILPALARRKLAAAADLLSDGSEPPAQAVALAERLAAESSCSRLFFAERASLLLALGEATPSAGPENFQKPLAVAAIASFGLPPDWVRPLVSRTALPSLDEAVWAALTRAHADLLPDIFAAFGLEPSAWLGSDGKGLIESAVDSGSLPLLSAALLLGADPNAPFSDGARPVEAVLAKACASAGWTPGQPQKARILVGTLEEQFAKMAVALIRAGADVPPSGFEAALPSSGAHLADLFLEPGFERPWPSMRFGGASALECAVLSSSEPLLRKLLEAGADPDEPFSDGVRPIVRALTIAAENISPRRIRKGAIAAASWDRVADALIQAASNLSPGPDGDPAALVGPMSRSAWSEREARDISEAVGACPSAPRRSI